MTGERTRLSMLYDDRLDVSVEQLERLFQALVWLADTVVVPSYLRPDPLAPEEQRNFVARRLAELAEAGFVRYWALPEEVCRVPAASWWPASTGVSRLTPESYAALQHGVRTGVDLYRDDVFRGIGRPPRSMMSGISEFVSLRDSLWTIGMARFLSVDYLLSSDKRSLALTSPLRRLAAVGAVTGPVSKKIMELHGIGALSALSTGDLVKLRRYKPSARNLVAKVVDDVERSPVPLSNYDDYLRAALERTQAHYAELLGEAVRAGRRNSATGNAVGLGISLAGTIFPPLGALSFAQPLLSWDPSGRAGRQLVAFLAQLKKRTGNQPG